MRRGVVWSWSLFKVNQRSGLSYSCCVRSLSLIKFLPFLDLLFFEFSFCRRPMSD